MSVVTSGSIAKALWPGLNKIFGDEYKRHADQWKEIFSANTSKKAYEDDLEMMGLGLAPTKTEGNATAFDAIAQSFVSRYTHFIPSLGMIATYEAIQDEQYGVLKKQAKALATSMKITKETHAANVLNRAFNSSYTGGDGLEMCSLLHLKKSGGTYANELSTASDLNEDSLEQALIDIAGFTDDRGLQIAAKGRKLVVPRQLIFDAERLLNSTGQPGTANNDLNAIASTKALPEGYRVNHYLTDTDAWFILTDVDDGLKMFQRESVKFKDDNDFDTFNAKYLAFERYSFGWTNPRGIFGSPGV